MLKGQRKDHKIYDIVGHPGEDSRTVSSSGGHFQNS